MPPRKLQHYLPGFKIIDLIPGVAPYFVVPVGSKPPETLSEMASWPIHYQFAVDTVYNAFPDVPRVKMPKCIYRALTRNKLVKTLKEMGIPLPKDFAKPYTWNSIYLTERINYVELSMVVSHRMCAERISFQFRHTLASYHNAVVGALKTRAIMSYTFHHKGRLDGFVLPDDLHTQIW